MSKSSFLYIEDSQIDSELFLFMLLERIFVFYNIITQFSTHVIFILFYLYIGNKLMIKYLSRNKKIKKKFITS